MTRRLPTRVCALAASCVDSLGRGDEPVRADEGEGAPAELRLEQGSFTIGSSKGCDIVIGYGRSKYANPWLIGSTIIELPSWKILRFGGCYEQQVEIVRKHFGVELPPRPTEGKMSLV